MRFGLELGTPEEEFGHRQPYVGSSELGGGPWNTQEMDILVANQSSSWVVNFELPHKSCRESKVLLQQRGMDPHRRKTRPH